MSARPLPLIALALTVASACRDADPPTAPARPVVTADASAAAAWKSVVPTGKAIGTLSDPMGPRTKYRVEYHTGPIAEAATNVYYIWYGSWSNDPAVSILSDLAITLGGSPYFSILTRYADVNGATPNGGIVFGGSVTDLYSRGATLSDDDIWSVVKDQIEGGGVPTDTRGIYVVLTSPDVTASSGYATNYCAFHQRVVYYGMNIRFVFVGGAARSPSQCAPQMVGPNGDYQADAMASLLAAELANTIVDPTLDAYYDRLGYEPADKCAWTYGTTYQTANGALANVRLGQRDFLLQQLWVPTRSGGRCALSP